MNYELMKFSIAGDDSIRNSQFSNPSVGSADISPERGDGIKVHLTVIL